MSNIQSFAPKTRLNSKELLTFGRLVEQKITESNPQTLGIEELFNQVYKPSLQSMDDSIIAIMLSNLTGEKKKADQLRDSYQTAVIQQARIFLSHFDPVKKEHAVHLNPVVERYKNTTQRSYEEQTSLTNNLLQELESDTYRPDVTALGLTDWVAALKSANQECFRLSSLAVEEKGARNTVPKLGDTRGPFEDAYDALVKRLNALAEVNGDSKYHELFIWWNALIDRYRILLSNRLGAGKGGTTDKGTSNRPAPTPPPTPGGEDDRPVIE